MVVAKAPMVRVFITEPSHMSRLPLVADGLELCKFSTPFIAKIVDYGDASCTING